MIVSMLATDPRGLSLFSLGYPLVDHQHYLRNSGDRSCRWHGCCTSAPLEAVGGWRILCSIVALLTASGTVAGALHKSFQITTRLSSAERCVARLRALDAAIAATDLPADNVLETFQRISEEHATSLA
jgi:hypothetical protein